MMFLAYAAFLVVSYWLVLQIFRLSTYHAYFWKSLPLLLAYSVAVGYALFSISHPYHLFFWTQIWGSALLFTYTFLKQWRRGKTFWDMHSEPPKERAVIQLSMSRTRTYFILSAVIYLFVYAVSYLAFLNL